LPSPHDDVVISLLVSLPPSYPASSPPQLQLSSRYIGAFGAESGIHIAHFYIYRSTELNGHLMVCAFFDGLENILERCVRWYSPRKKRRRQTGPPRLFFVSSFFFRILVVPESRIHWEQISGKPIFSASAFRIRAESD